MSALTVFNAVALAQQGEIAADGVRTAVQAGQLGNHQAVAHLLHQCVEILLAGLEEEVCRSHADGRGHAGAAGVAGGFHALLAGGLAAVQQGVQHTVFDNGLGAKPEALRRAYFVSDGEVYASSTFSDLIKKELGNPWLLRIKCPLFLLKCISVIAEWGAKCAGKTSTLNRDKYNIMKQRNWRCDISPIIRELGFKPEYLLEKGVKETIAWYKKEGWL